MITRWLCGLVAVLCLSAPAWGATDISLVQSDGTKTPLGGDGDAAKVTPVNGSGGIGQGTSTEADPEITEGAPADPSFDLSGYLRVKPIPSTSDDLTNQGTRVFGGAVRPVTIMTGVTTNTTSATQVVFSGAKTPMASVTGTGALTATVQFYGDMENTTTHGEPICPAIVLAGTTKAVGFCPQITKDYPYYHAVTTVITGTSATVEAWIVVGSDGMQRPEWLSSTNKVADALIKTGYGWLQCILISQNDAAPTAGTISVNDAVSAGTGTPLFTWVLTTAVFTPFQVCPQVPFTTGLYFDFTTTGDVNVTASYR